MVRAYIPERGFQMDDDFATHQSHCSRCAQYVDDNPSTMGALCLDGSILIKRLKAKESVKREPKVRLENWGSIKEIKAATRYK